MESMSKKKSESNLNKLLPTPHIQNVIFSTLMRITQQMDVSSEILLGWDKMVTNISPLENSSLILLYSTHYIPHISQSALTLFLMPSFLPNTYARVLYSKKYLRHIVLHNNRKYFFCDRKMHTVNLLGHLRY